MWLKPARSKGNSRRHLSENVTRPALPHGRNSDTVWTGMTITQAESSKQIAEARALFKEYAAWLEIDLCFQNFDQELAGLPGDYAPPDGRLLLAQQNNQVVGCIALRKLGDGICEMKRLFVRPA